MNDATNAHKVTVTVGDRVISGWTSYEISSSMIEPCDSFSMERPASRDAIERCKPDARVAVAIDGVVVIDGFIDKAGYSAKAGTLKISGRDKVGRLIQESIPKVGGYDGLQLVEAIKKLASPWFSTVTISDNRNRLVRRGKGGKALTGAEPIVLPSVGKSGRLDPGETRWQVIEKLVSQAGLLCWSSADGRELVVSKPNYRQDQQFFIAHRLKGSTCIDLEWERDVSDAYARIEAHGSGVGDEGNYGDSVTSHGGLALDGTNADGTGGLFAHPKRLLLAQQAVANRAEANKVAAIELARRKFKSNTISATMPTHGQIYRGSTRTLFTPNTIAEVDIDMAEADLSGGWLIHTVKYRASRSEGETTVIDLVPVLTEIYQ